MKTKLLKAFAIILLAFSFIACGNLMNDIDSSSNKKKSSKAAHVSITFSNFSNRTAMPDINIFNLEDFELYTKTADQTNYTLLQRWNNYDSVSESILDIEPGTYDFKLCANCQGLKYQDTKTAQTINLGANNLDFSLSFAGMDLTEGQGAFQITVDYSNSTQEIKAVTASLFTQDDQPIQNSQDEPLPFSFQNTATYTKSNISTGTYHIVFNLYADEQKNYLVSTFQETAVVINNFTSTSTTQISIVNSVYDAPVTFVLNGLSWKSEVSLPDVTQTRLSKDFITDIPSVEAIDILPKATFYGWYKSPDFSETSKISQINSKDFGRTITIYAKSNQTNTQNLNNLLPSFNNLDEPLEIIITYSDPIYEWIRYYIEK